MPKHVFVDETKEHGYLVTAAAVLTGDLAAARRVIRGLIMPRQRRIHFTKESDARRKQILDALGELALEVTIYDGSAHPRRRQREACLHSMVADLAAIDARLLVIERDESVEELDRKLLYRRVRELGCADTLVYRHQRTHEEPLLVIPDAIAWCWYRGGHWRTRISPMVTAVRKV
jgi:hypothetical protein